MSIKKVANVSKQMIKQYIKDGNFRRNNRYSRYYENYPIRNNYILYETRDGKSMTCNPYAIFKYLLNAPEYKDYIHVWSIDKLKENGHLIEEYKGYKNVKFINRNSREYLKYLASCKYLINNSSFPNFFQAKEEQIYINTWHGTPLKYMGRDIPGTPTQLKNILRNFLQTKYMLMPNAHTTDVFVRSYQLDGLYEGSILETGYPRNDLTLNLDQQAYRQKLSRLGIKVDKKIVLYAPTWKGSNVHKPKNEADDIIQFIMELQSKIDSSEYNVLVKVHPFIYKYIKNREEIRDICIPDYLDTNEILGVVDILITDYSSIFFDFLITKKPILFYMKDEKEYQEERGMYLSNKELPGPVAYRVNELADLINQINKVEVEYADLYNTMRERFCKYDDGNVTERVVRTIFKEEKNVCKEIVGLGKKKEKLLIYGGGFFNNGITVSLINLLDHINYDKYDITVLTADTADKAKLKNINKLDPRVRLLFRTGTFNITILERLKEKYILHKGVYTDFQKKMYPKKAYAREYKRIVGHSEFDYIIDYSGYSMFWDNIILEGEARQKIIYLHNNMPAELYKKDKGRYVHLMNLTGVFSRYKEFDKLVSVTESCKEANEEGLMHVSDKAQHYYLNNPVNYEKIIRMANEYESITIEDEQHMVLVDNESILKRKLELLKMPSKQYINFLNIGRLSEEKGQFKLIEAFKMVTERHELARLYIMGEGNLRKQITGLIKSLSLEDKVFLVGQLDNPYAFLKQCDCFVLSSNHEGQGLVVLESMILDVPVISTDIPGPRSLLEGGYGELVDNSPEALREAMERFIKDSSKHKAFDYKTYNEKTMHKFYQLLEEK